MATKSKRAKRTPARRADAEDETSAKRDELVLLIRLQMLHRAETLARSIGPEGIAERRLDLAREPWNPPPRPQTQKP